MYNGKKLPNSAMYEFTKGKQKGEMLVVTNMQRAPQPENALIKLDFVSFIETYEPNTLNHFDLMTFEELENLIDKNKIKLTEQSVPQTFINECSFLWKLIRPIDLPITPLETFPENIFTLDIPLGLFSASKEVKEILGVPDFIVFDMTSTEISLVLRSDKSTHTIRKVLFFKLYDLFEMEHIDDLNAYA